MDFPINSMVIFHSYVNVYQRVYSILCWLVLFPLETPVMGELPSLLGAVQMSCTDLGGPGRRTVVLPRKPWGSLQGCLYQADMACYHVTNKEVGMYQEEMWIWQH